jgi:hypothetical protein
MALGARFLMAGSVRAADRGPVALEVAVVLTAVKDAARRRGGGPEDGPSLTAAARAGCSPRRSGRKDGPVEQKDAGRQQASGAELVWRVPATASGVL